MKKQSNSSTTSASNVTIGSGVTFTGYGQAIYNIDGTTTTVTVNGATFKKDSKISNSGRIYNSGTGTISIVSGTFEGLLNNNSTGSISITGGTFASNPSSYVDANNYTVTSNDDGTYTVTAKSLNEE